MVKTRKILGIIVIMALLLSNALFVGQAVAVVDDLPLREEPPLPPGPEEEYIPDQIIVKFKETTLRSVEASLNETLGTEVIYTSPFAGFKVLKIPEGKTVAEMVEAYSGQAIVEYAEPNYVRLAIWSPNDEFYDYQWHFDQINMETAWDLDTTAPNYGGDPNIIVAVLDTGVAYETYGGYVQAPDLADTNFWTNPGETAGNSVDDDGNGYVDDVHGWDFANNDAHPNDDDSHGTHVCGTIAQSTNNSLGVAGIAFNTTIMPVKVLPGGIAEEADGIYYATDNGAQIINMSTGGPGTSSTEEDALAYAYGHGVTIICAAGNDYETGNDPEYPAAYDDYCIAVGAVRFDQTHAYYSNTGSYLDIAAPGGDMTVDQNGDDYGDGVLQQTFAEGDPTDFGYYFFQGTSMACPHVSGVAALILAKNPTWTPDQVRQALESTATDLGDPGRDDVYGWGLLNAPAAVGAAANTPPEVTNVTASQSSPIVDITYDVSDAEQSEVSISFEYWDGSSWWACITTTGEGTQSTGTGKSGTWDAKADRDEHYMPDCKIRVIADDGQAENNIFVAQSNTFTLDTKDPTGYGCSTPTNGAIDVSINPLLTCLTALDDSPPISYYFQLAENDTFTLGLQESSWQSSATWSPSTLSYNEQYFWRVKAKDSYGNETDYGSTFDFITESGANNPPNAPDSPLCEGVTNPTGVTDPTPEFGWTFSDPDGGDTQGAYQILVASTSENLAADNGDMWDSTKVGSSASEVSYAGTALTQNQTYYWKVKTWDNLDADGPYCGEQQFTTGTSPSEVWVDDSWAGSSHGDPVDGHTFGTDAFATIQDGIDAVAGSTVHVAAGDYYENIILKDGVEVLGAGADVTTVDGGGSGSVVTAIGVGSTTVLDGFTITNGSAGYGGGMSNSVKSSPTVTNCTFSGNSANHGGGMYNYSSSPTVTNCTFSGNSATNYGGGMYNSINSSPTVTNCTFSGNSASEDGGGMRNSDNSSPAVTGCAFSGNSATNYGGGMYNIKNSSPIVTNCTFSGNSANHGGGMYNFNSSPTVTNCTFSGNSATYDGGGMSNWYSSPTVTNCIISTNTASQGGGIYSEDSSPIIDYNDVWNNSPDDYYGCSAGTHDISQDPLFVGPLVDDYHLQSGSPCIDVGDNEAPSLPSTDFEGDPRIVDGDGDTVAVVDMGADEYLPSALNTPPEVTTVTASQSSPIVDITYNVSDDEQSEVSISFEYWDGASWQVCITTTGDGTQSTGTGKSGTWDAKTDFDEHYTTDCKIRVTADDGQAENNIGTGESNTFTLDTKDPTGYGCNTPINGATLVSVNPDLTCLTASDDSPTIFYYFQLAENDTFTQGLQESGWQGSSIWSPSSLGYNKQYFWRVKAKDNYGNETDYGSTFNFTTQAEAGASATRTLPASVDPGAHFDVTITASGCGICGQVVETLPSGFSYVSCASSDVSPTPEDNMVKFTFVGDSVIFTYTVKASTTQGIYTFSGIVKDENKVEYPVGGDTSITVGFDPMHYDEDEDGVMEIGEVLNAISDYFADEITITEVLEVIALYFAS